MIRQLQQVSWKEIPGYNGLYLLSEFGNIFNTKTGKFLVVAKPKKAALYVNLCYNGNVNKVVINKLLTEIHGNT